MIEEIRFIFIILVFLLFYFIILYIPSSVVLDITEQRVFSDGTMYVQGNSAYEQMTIFHILTITTKDGKTCSGESYYSHFFSDTMIINAIPDTYEECLEVGAVVTISRQYKILSPITYISIIE